LSDGRGTARALVAATREFVPLAATWADGGKPAPAVRPVMALHQVNYRQWQSEDELRRPDLSDATLVRVRRRIERLNASRHASIEALDEELAAAIPMEPGAELHSETPGMIADRLSVLSIRLHFTRHAAFLLARPDLTARVPVVQEQIGDLRMALERLLDACLAGRRRFKTYRELKLYEPG